MTATEDEAPFVLDELVRVFLGLRDAWRAALNVRECADGAPWQWASEEPDDVPITAADMLIMSAQESGMLAAQGVTQHLGLLARAYWLDPADPDGPESDRWLYGAPFAPARAVIEGTAIVGWLLDPSIEHSERACRGAMLGLWSRPSEWEDDARAAGLDIRTDERGVRFVWTGEGARPLSLHTMIKATHGAKVTRTYGRWSKLLHYDPHLIGRGTCYLMEDRGRVGVGVMREDEHLVVAAEVASALAAAARAQAGYFGRSAADLLRMSEEIVTMVQAQFPAVTDVVTSREAGR